MYNVADEVPLSTNEGVSLIVESKDVDYCILSFPKFIGNIIAKCIPSAKSELIRV